MEALLVDMALSSSKGLEVLAVESTEFLCLCVTFPVNYSEQINSQTKSVKTQNKSLTQGILLLQLKSRLRVSFESSCSCASQTGEFR